jgi:tight adherence protein C
VNPAIVLGVGVGLGLIGAVAGLTPGKQKLQSILRTMEDRKEMQPERSGRIGAKNPDRSVREVSRLWLKDRALVLLDHYPKVALRLHLDLQATCVRLEDLVERVAFAGLLGALGPLLLWLLLSMLGGSITLLIPVSFVVFVGGCSSLLPIVALRKRANHARRLARTLVGSYLDLVVLGLAGGLGVEGALHSAALTCETPLSHRLVRVMDEARDAGRTPWAALAGLGRELEVPELEELAVAVSLAGTEGARIKSTLAAKAASIRIHELADAETEANTVSERLFVPGVFMLMGFLIFIGYPAVTRLTTGL